MRLRQKSIKRIMRTLGPEAQGKGGDGPKPKGRGHTGTGATTLLSKLEGERLTEIEMNFLILSLN